MPKGNLQRTDRGKDLYSVGWKASEISTELGVSQRTVYYWKKAYQWNVFPSTELRRECRLEKVKWDRIYSIIENSFQCPVILTVLFSPIRPMPLEFVRKYISSYDKTSKRKLLAEYGIKYEYLRIAEYLDHKTGEIQFRYIADLTEAQCKLISSNWVMGKVRIEKLLLENLKDALTPACESGSSAKQQEEKRMKTWTRTRGLKYNPLPGS